MKIAVSVNGLDFIVRTNGKAYLGLISGAELFTLIAEPGLKRYPFDIVFFGHSVRHGADFNADRVVFDGVNGDMFFLRRIDRSGNDFLHFLSAAHNRNARIFNESDDIAAMSANIKSLFHNSVSLKILRRFILKSIVFRMKLEIGLRVCAYGADFRRLYAYDNMTAIAAFPDLNVAFFENLGYDNVAEKSAVTFLVLFFDFRNQTEFDRKLGKTVLLGGFCEAFVHIRPFIIFAFGSRKQIFRRVSYTRKLLQPELGVFFFVIRRFQKQFCYLFKALFFSRRSEISILIAGL